MLSRSISLTLHSPAPGLLRLPDGFNWKTAPDLKFLAQHGQLWIEYAKVAPNSMVPPKKHKIAIEKLDSMQKCNLSKKSQRDFVDCIDNSVRCCLKHFRDLKKEFNRERAFRKVDQDIQRIIMSALSHLSKVSEDDIAIDEDDSQGRINPSVPAIMDKEPDTPHQTKSQPTPGEVMAIQLPKQGKKLSPSKLFDQILNKAGSDEELDIKYTDHTQKKPRLESTSSTTPHQEDMVKGKRLASFLSPHCAVTRYEEELMEEAMSQGPIEQLRQKKQKKTGLKRPAAASEPSKKSGKDQSAQHVKKAKDDKQNVKKAKAKAKTNIKTETQCDETTENTEQPLEMEKTEKTKETKKTKKTKQAQGTKETKETKKTKQTQETKETKKTKTKEVAPRDPSKDAGKKTAAETNAPSTASALTRASDKDPIILGDHIFDGMWDMEDVRAKVRHRLESRAHHEFLKEFQNRDGYNPNQHKQLALARAKQARQAFGVEFEKKWPKTCTQEEAKALDTKPHKEPSEEVKQEKQDSEDEPGYDDDEASRGTNVS
eukprot:Skav206339  [mRNA]  locus=scaffold1420:518901:520526:+ [translate_table: standard]